jgi:hypothetical protein
MSLLTIVQDACILVGLDQPSAAASSVDTSIKQIVALASKTGREVARWHDWSTLSIAGSFTGDGTTTVFNLPADFDRFAQNEKIILDGGIGTISTGPLSASEITAFRARSPITVAFVHFRRGNQFTIAPALAANRKAIFEYQSKNWCASSSGTPQSGFLADTDVALIDEELITNGIAWRWRQIKGFDYAQEYEDWRQAVELRAAFDRGRIPVAAGSPYAQLPDPVTPDTIILGT